MTQHFATHNARLQVNADEVRTEELNGREHVVAPVTLVREMVLKGELLPFEEIQRTAMAWNGSPVTVTHPRDDDGGFLPASMNAAEFERHTVGHVFGTEADPGRRALDGEVWMDAERAAETAAALDRDDPAGMLLDGEPVEVSTGYWYRKDDATGTYEGAEYSAQQRDVQPDHLASLPNGEGECSLEDGCGAGAGTDAAAAAASTVTQGAPISDGGDASLLTRIANAVGIDTDATGELETACYCSDGCDCDDETDVSANQDVGDAVRWESDASGSVTVDGTSYRYGVVVDGLQGEDDPEDSVLVAVYEPSDGEWENRDEENPIAEDRLEVVGSDGVGSLPPISQLGGQSCADDGQSSPSSRMVLVTDDDNGTNMTTFDMDELASHSGLSVETLESLDDDELEALAERTLQDDEEGDGDGENSDGPDDDGSDDGGDDTETANAVMEKLEDIEQRLEAQEEAGASRGDLIATIQTHAEDVPEEDLEDMSTSALKAMADSVAPTGGVYAGRAGAAGTSSTTDEPTGVPLDALGGDD